MSTKITATELAKSLSDILNRVRYRGESFVVERNGEAVAEIRPLVPRKVVTLADLADIIRSLPPPDEGFLDVIEEAQRSQTPPKFPEWPS